MEDTAFYKKVVKSNRPSDDLKTPSPKLTTSSYEFTIFYKLSLVPEINQIGGRSIDLNET